MLNVLPEALSTAAGDLANLGNMIEEANAVAAQATTQIAPAAADEVSAAIAALFNTHGGWWQSLAAQAQAFQASFTQGLIGAAQEYLTAEVVNRGAVGLGENLVSLQTGPGFAATLSSSVPLDLLLSLTNTGIPVLGPWLNQLAMSAVGAG